MGPLSGRRRPTEGAEAFAAAAVAVAAAAIAIEQAVGGGIRTR